MNTRSTITPLEIGGKRFLFNNLGDSKTTKDLVWEWEFDFFSLSRAMVAPKEAIVLLGAGAGAHAIGLAKRYPQNHIFAIEPDAALFLALKQNVTASELRNITPIVGWPSVTKAETRSFRDIARNMRRWIDPRLLKTGLHYCESPVSIIDPDWLMQTIRQPIAVCVITSGGREMDALHVLHRLGGCRYIVGLSGLKNEAQIIETALRYSCECYFWRFMDDHHRFLSGRGSRDVFLSVVVPIYNVEKELGQCLESLTKTVHPNVEFLCVNDGSTDSSPDIVKSFSRKDPRFRLLNKKNGGCAAARNTGLDNAKGEYIGFVDSDDWVDDGFFDVLIASALKNGVDIVHAGLVKEYQADKKQEIVDENWLYNGLDGADNVIDRNTFYPLQPTIWRRIYRHRFLTNNGIRFYEKLPRFDDLPFQFETFMTAETIALEPSVRYHYRLQRKGQDVLADDDRLFVHFEIFEVLRNSIVTRGEANALQGLAHVSENTHNWALSNIQSQFKEAYKSRTRKCLDATATLAIPPL